MDYSKGSVTKHLRSDARESSGSLPTEVKVEKQGIRGLTLLFENKEMERKWSLLHMSQTRNMTMRSLVGSSLFQAVFFWSDVLESQRFEKLEIGMFMTGTVRLALGLSSLLLCFFVALRLIQPTQMTLYLANMLYAVPTLLIFYSNRPEHTHWDSLYLSYGLAFFLLPKMSPLKFSYATAGSLILTIIFIYTSAFRLSFQEWMLSNVFVLSIFSLMSYVSYSSERASRERWLLKQRLEREKISLRLVAGSIQDDLRRAAREDQIKGNLRRLEIMSVSRGLQDGLQDSLQMAKKSISAIRGGGLMSAPSLFWPATGASASENPAAPSSNAAITGDLKREDMKKNLVLFFKGLSAWAMVVLMSYTFDMASRAGRTRSAPQEYTEVSNSTAFVLLMHTFGFSVFLLYFTGQIRWLLINGMVGLTLMWMFNLSGMDRKWIVFGTHTVGYIILLVVVIVMVLVFGGVVMVWSNLMEFLKDILTRYPQVKGELSENKLLEQVIVSVISELPEPVQDGQYNRNMSLEVTSGIGDLESPLRRRTDWSAGGGGSGHSLDNSSYRDLTLEDIQELELDIRNSKQGGKEFTGSARRKSKHTHGGPDRTHSTGNSSNNNGSPSISKAIGAGSSAFQYHSIITSSNSEDGTDCYFCTNRASECLIPVCDSWKHGLDLGSGNLGDRSGRGGPTCTELSHLSQEKERAVEAQRTAVNECYRFMEQCSKLEENLALAEETLHQLRSLHTEKEKEADASKATLKRKFEEVAEKNAAQMRRQHMSEVTDMLAAHHAQIADLQAQIDAMQLAQRQAVWDRQADVEREAEAPLRQRTASIGSGRSGSSSLVARSKTIVRVGEFTSEDSKRNASAASEPASTLSISNASVASFVDKNGIDITYRSLRRNVNNPNNPLYNPELKKPAPTAAEIRELTTKLLTRSHLNSHSSYDSLEDVGYTIDSVEPRFNLLSVDTSSDLPPLWEPPPGIMQPQFSQNEESRSRLAPIPPMPLLSALSESCSSVDTIAEDEGAMPHLREIQTLLDN